MDILIGIFNVLLALHIYKKIPATNRYINNPENPSWLKIVDVVETFGSIAVFIFLIINYYIY